MKRNYGAFSHMMQEMERERGIAGKMYMRFI